MGNVFGVGLLIAAILLVAGTSAGEQLVSGLSGKLSPEEIAQYAANAGFTGADLQTAVAIALAESGGNSASVGDLNLGVSIGLWQINEKYHPEDSGLNLKDPQTNANAAYAIYVAAGYSFRPWSTYKNGAFNQYADVALQAVASQGLNA